MACRHLLVHTQRPTPEAAEEIRQLVVAIEVTDAHRTDSKEKEVAPVSCETGTWAAA